MLAEVAAVAQDYLSSPSVLSDQLTAAGLTAWVIQKLKNSDWPIFKWVNENSKLVNRAMSVAMALGTSAGFHWVWEGSLAQGGNFSFHAPPIQEWGSYIWRSGGSFIMTEMVYQTTIKHDPGQSAADVVADTVEARKEELAEVVESHERKEEIEKLTDPKASKPKSKRSEPAKLPWK